MAIHVTAIVDHTAEVDATAEIGPYCIIESGVRIGPNTRLIANVYVCSGTTIGARCRIHPNAVLGDLAQDLSTKGEPSYVRIGDDNWIRENVTIHRGTEPGSATTIGNHCFFMANSHVGHNCTVGDHVILAQAAVVGGRAFVGDRVFLGGMAAIHQFVRVGEYVMLGGIQRALQDVPPFCMYTDRGLVGLNVVGLRRNGFESATRNELRDLYRFMFRTAGNFQEKLQLALARATTPAGRRFVEFLSSPSKRGFAGYRGKSARKGSALDDVDQE